MPSTWEIDCSVDGCGNIVMPSVITEKYRLNHLRLKAGVFNTHLLPSMLPTGDHINFIYVIRSARDVVVSFFHHLSNQHGDGGIDSTFEDYLNDWCNGDVIYGSWIAHLREWITEINNPTSLHRILLVKYEDMKSDLVTVVAKISNFMSVPLNESQIAEISRITSFDIMKDNKTLYQPKSVKWKNEFEFIRKGEVGDSLNYFGNKEESIFQSMLHRAFPGDEGSIPEWLSTLGVV